MLKVVMVEDDADLLDEMSFNLRQQGFQITQCAHGKEFDRVLQTERVDVVVLDIGLPGESGLSIARRLRRNLPLCGIVMLTGRSGVTDRIHGMEEGADAYLSKPVDMRELALVIRAVARRVAPAEVGDREGLVLVEQDQVLLLADGLRVDMTRLETLLLSRLARATGQQATRQQLVEALGENYRDYDQRRLETIVSRLRQKLTRAGLESEALRAIRQTGYIFTVPLSARDSIS
ncbi:MAG: response regulator transcription factor [Gallionella sp.]|jgi:DNA-binding response OmpR family regulator|nr:response regulator transcription factor [Gallionella sp.]MCK9354452.1 response regulator transcription factor [Gallionella sp.]